MLVSTLCIQAGSSFVNRTLRLVIGNWWPEVSGVAYFAVLFCFFRQVRRQKPCSLLLKQRYVRPALLPAHPVQVTYFFLAVWLTFKFESTHRQSFLRHLGVQPSEATEYNSTSYIESIFLSCNVLGIACMVTTDVLGAQIPPLTAAACLALPA